MEDTAMINEELGAVSLCDYVNQYTGYQKIVRLQSLINDGHNIDEKTVVEAIQTGFKVAANMTNLGMYLRIQKSAKNYFDKKGKPMVQNLDGISLNTNKLSADYNSLIKNKQNEIQRQEKSLIKETLRISYKELGQIHYNHGFTQEANQYWIRSFDMSIQEEDIFQMAYFIARSAFQTEGQEFAVSKFSEEAVYKDKKKNSEQSALAMILQGLSFLQNKNFNHAVLKFIQVKIPDNMTQEFAQVLTQTDLAFYIALCSLVSCSRSELKETILKSANFATLTETSSCAANIIECFLNGNYLEFQKHLKTIKNYLKYDIYFGEHKKVTIFRDIRLKALQQHVKAYKVISIAEIAHEFHDTEESIEKDLVNLIQQGKIIYKIDSFNKTLHQKVKGQKMATLKQVVISGEHYLSDTETFLLKAKLFQDQEGL